MGSPKHMNIIWKSNLTDKLKRNFFRTAVQSVLVRVHHLDTDIIAGEKTGWSIYSHATSCIK